MRLDEVLPELMGSLALSELLFSGEGLPWACSRMDQYQRKMRKPVGSKGHRDQKAGSNPPPTPPSQGRLDSELPLALFLTDVTSGAPTMCQALCNSLHAISLCSLEVPMRLDLFNTILYYKRGNRGPGR